MYLKLVFLVLGAMLARFCSGDLTLDVGPAVTTALETEPPATTGETSSEGKTQTIGESSESTNAVHSDKEVEKTAITDEPSEGSNATENVAETASSVNVTLKEQESKCIISNATHWSWLVKIVEKTTQKHVCTGTLITDEDVLVPASCFLDNTSYIPDSFYSRGQNLVAIAGGTTNTTGICKQTRNVSVIYPHKGYFEDSDEHDYAFVKVSPEFDVDDEDIPDLRYHLNVINSEGGLVNIHNNGPFCESPFFVDDGTDVLVSEERHLLGMRIEDCMMKWGCPGNFKGCLSYLHPASYACLKPLAPRACSARDRGAPLVCNDVFLGFLHLCDGEKPMIFRGLNKAIKFLELEEDHVQQPGYLGHTY